MNDRLPVRSLFRAQLPPDRAYRAWLAAHGLTMRDHAEAGGYQQTDVSAVVSGRKSSRPILEWIERETGIPADGWT